jgi:acetaldehyde dehydrogenase
MKVHIGQEAFHTKMRKIKVAIIGSGNIGSDLCARLLKDPEFEVIALVGRRSDSPGLLAFKDSIPYVVSTGIEGFGSLVDKIDGAFDATSAYDHLKHWEILGNNGKWIIDLTPSKIGQPIVPELVTKVPVMEMKTKLVANYSMVTCGGQSSAPLLYAMALHSKGVSEVEVSSSIASLSAGPATRRNIDQYIESTENLIQLITGCQNVKAILVLNPVEPPVMMRTTIQMKVETCNLESMIIEAHRIESRINQYVPGYKIVVEPHLTNSYQLSATVKVTGAGYVLPDYSGNLDIINAAAVETARLHVRKHDIEYGVSE